MKTKYLDRRHWRRLLRSDYRELRVENERFDGIIGLITMYKVKSPLQVQVVDQHLTVADRGYKWVQILPKDKPFSITAMYNRYWQPVQYYIDINEKNFIEIGEARTHDLFLDVLVLPNGKYELVDEQDLKRALRNGTITKQQYDYAYHIAEEMMQHIKTNFSHFEEEIQYCKSKIAPSE